MSISAASQLVAYPRPLLGEGCGSAGLRIGRIAGMNASYKLCDMNMQPILIIYTIYFLKCWCD